MWQIILVTCGVYGLTVFTHGYVFRYALNLLNILVSVAAKMYEFDYKLAISGDMSR